MVVIMKQNTAFVNKKRSQLDGLFIRLIVDYFFMQSYLKKNWIAFLVLTAVILIAYFNSFNNGFMSDDISILQKNPNLTFSYFLQPPLRIMHNLFVFISYKMGYNVPFFYRIINILFHIGTAWAVYFLFSLLLNPVVAFFSAMIFAVHPILVESVAWISGGVYVQYSFFIITSLICYILSKKNARLYPVSIGLFLLSLFTAADKAIVYPLILFVYELSQKSLRKNWKKLIAYFILSFLVAGYYFFGGDVAYRFLEIKTSYYQDRSFFNPLIQIPVAITSYLQLIFWPDKLTLYHSEMSFGQIEYLIRMIGLIGLICLIGYCWKKNKQLFFWLLFFIISLLPTLTPFGISWIVAERYVYLGSIGVIGVIGYVLGGIMQNKKTEGIGYMIFIIIILGLMTRTIMRNMDWKNEDTLWIATGKTSPSDPKTHNNLGDVYGRWGNLKLSAEEFKIAIQLNPRYADAYHNLGNTYQQMGSSSAALEQYQLALKYNPNLWQSHQNIAAIYFSQKEYERAEQSIIKAIQVFPNNPQLHVNLGTIYLFMKDRVKAEKEFYNALSIDPNNQQAKLGLLELRR
jgi:tetratricopeptide (TPR) repeat protein